MVRRVLGVVALLAMAGGAAAGDAGFKKAYFGATRPGTFAKQKATDEKGAVSEYTYSRLPDQAGEAWIENSYRVVSGQYKGTNSVTSCLMPATFSVENDAIDFMGNARRCVSATRGMRPTEFPPETMKAIRDGGTYYAKMVSFKGTETVDGRTADHYTYAYATNYMNIPAHTTGDIWLSDEVPFGLVKDVMVTKDKAGKVLTRIETVLAETGQDAKTALAGWSWTPKARAKAPVKVPKYRK